MRIALRIIALAWLIALFAAPGASAGAGGTIPSAGSRDHAYFVWPPALPGAPASRICVIHHIPATDALGSIRSARQVPGSPALLAADADRLILIHEPPPPPEVAPGGTPSPERAARRVETITTARAEIGSSFFEYRPVGRDPEALPSLPASGKLLAAALTREGPFVLLEDGGALSLLAQVGAEWRAVALPDASAALAPTIVAMSDRLLLAERAPAGEPRARESAPRIWSASAADLVSSATPAQPEAWRRDAYAIAGRDESLLAAGDALLACARRPGGDVTLRLLRPTGASHPLATVHGVGDDFAVIPLADRVNIVWFQKPDSATPTPRLHTAVVSAITGETLFRGPAQAGAIVSARSLLTLALLLGAVLLTALVFILRPDPTDAQAIVLPPGAALAGPGRRFIAACVDIGIPTAIVSSVFNIAPGEILEASLLSADAGLGGAGALLALLFLTILHTSLSEWLAGSTLGKRLVSCRTISVRGGKPALWQAVVRNALKLLCPPLALFLLVDPRSRHPADVLARTAVVVMTKPLPPEPPSPGDPPSRPPEGS